MFHYYSRRRWHRRRDRRIALFFILMFALRAAVAILSYMRRELEELAYVQQQRRPSTSTEIQPKHVPF